jgi:hypothetical protein
MMTKILKGSWSAPLKQMAESLWEVYEGIEKTYL